MPESEEPLPLIRKMSALDNSPSIKDVRTRGGRGYVQCGPFADKRGSSDADVRNFLMQKTAYKLLKFMVCPAACTDEGGWTSVDIFRTSWRGHFSRVFAEVFYGLPVRP